MKLLHKHFLALAAFVAPLLSADLRAAQNNGIDPPVDGNLSEHLDLSLTFTDGYTTLMDVRMPTVAPNSTGWPIVLFVHTSGTSRTQVNVKAAAMARRGYATVTYDVRGQGPGMLLNDPGVYGRAGIGSRERIDMFEVIEGSTAQFPGLLDAARIGVTGRSQGAVHSWVAAAHSGRMPMPNPWRTSPFPTITAVAPINFIPDILEGTMPGGQTGTEMTIRLLYDLSNGIHHQPSFLAFVDGFVRNEDFSGLRSAMYDPNLDLIALLQTSNVPVQSFQVYDDKYAASNRLMDVWNSLVPGAQKVLNLSTTGHSSTFNDHENELREFRRDEWFAFHLKQVDNSTSRLPEFRFAIAPDNKSSFQSANSIWDAREFQSFPFPGTNHQNWYLNRNGTLSTSAPGTARKQSLDHRLEGDINSIDDYIAQKPHPDVLEKEIPIEVLSYETPPFQHDQFLIGEARMEVTVESNQQQFQIHAVLFSEPEGMYVTGGQATVRNHPGGQTILSFPLNFQGFMFSKGTSLRLQLENLAWHRPEVPNQPTFLQGLPIFQDFDLDVISGGSTPSKLILPSAPMSSPSLTATEVSLASSNNNDFSLVVRSDDSHAGWSYSLMAGSAGTEPGHFMNGQHVPLNRDWLTQAIEQNPNGLPISDFIGTLNNDGNAFPGVLLSKIAKLPPKIGELDFVVVLTSPQGEIEVSNPVIIPIL